MRTSKFKSKESSLTFRTTERLRSGFAAACDAAGLAEANVARLLMEGFTSGSIVIFAAGESPDPKSVKKPKAAKAKVKK